MSDVIVSLLIIGPPCGVSFCFGWQVGTNRERQKTIDYETARLERLEARRAATEGTGE